MKSVIISTMSAMPTQKLQNDSTPLMELDGITKKYQQVVLNNVSLTLMPGESLALVGANGAGKSTLIKILLGLAKPSLGTGKLMGFELDDPQARLQVGYLPETASFWPEMSARDLLSFFGSLRTIPQESLVKRVNALLKSLGLFKRSSRRMSTYSKGMLQRSGIAQALLHKPKLLILDEPMSGLDPRAQEKLRQILLKLKSEGVSLLISSHSLEDIRLLCDRVAVLEKSHLVLNGPTSEVLQTLAERYQSAEPWDEDPIEDVSAEELS